MSYSEMPSMGANQLGSSYSRASSSWGELCESIENRTISYKVFLIWVNLAFTFLINFSSAIKIQFLAWPTLINGRAISQSKWRKSGRGRREGSVWKRCEYSGPNNQSNNNNNRETLTRHCKLLNGNFRKLLNEIEDAGAVYPCTSICVSAYLCIYVSIICCCCCVSVVLLQFDILCLLLTCNNHNNNGKT